MLGFGAHDDPVGVMIDAIQEAQAIAKADNRPAGHSGYVLGTDQDPQSLAQQCERLTDAWRDLASSSTNTGLLAREFVCKGENA
ncbi:protein YahF [Enterobacter cancerogenus]|uniref:Protein YahF n=1 Tax=Enterobacter cancerogenus TaxID=69218 RepID=A0A484Z743_9ENTR|nr:protein YahF [Enterobacter cancerogenus]